VIKAARADAAKAANGFGGDAQADLCASVLEAPGNRLISSGRLAQALIVAARPNGLDEMAALKGGLGFKVANVTPAAARRIAAAYGSWGRGVHPARLNFGDCFAYEVAKENACPLLYVGDDFSRTDSVSAL